MEETTPSKKASNKKFILVGFFLLILVVSGIGGYFVLSGSKTKEPVENEEKMAGSAVKKVTADEIGLVLTPTQNNQVVMMEISKLDGITSIDYEVSYDATENGEVVPRGAIGFVELKGESTIERKIDLGTCSRNICKYDKGVEAVKFLLRINFKDGATGELEEELVFS